MSVTHLCLGCQVKAKPTFSSEFIHGTVMFMLKDRVYVQFQNLDARLSEWFIPKNILVTGPPQPEFKPAEAMDVRFIENVVFDRKLIKCWYFSPYPQPFNQLQTLYVCSRCLRYGTLEMGFKHQQTCKRTPPGIKIYDDGLFSFYEVDGRTEKLFCQFLCLFTRLFLDSKSIYYNTDWFLFYICTMRKNKLEEFQGVPMGQRQCVDTSTEEQIVGYFSKEKGEVNILSCILTFPTYQNLSIGQKMTDFAYILAKVENRIAGPETPLSDLGQISFNKYWKTKIFEYLLERADFYYGKCGEQMLYDPEESTTMSILQNSEATTPRRMAQKQILFVDLKDIVAETSILLGDIESVVEECGMFKVRRGNEIGISQQMHKQFYEYLLKEQVGLKGYKLNMKYLQWEPYPCMFCGPRE